MADPELDASTSLDSTFSNVSLPASDSTNYTSDTSDNTTDPGASNSLDQIFKYATQTAQLAQTVGIIPVGNTQASQATKNPNGTIQPSGANPVVQTTASTTAISWIQAHPFMAAGVGGGLILGGFVLYKLLK